VEIIGDNKIGCLVVSNKVLLVYQFAQQGKLGRMFEFGLHFVSESKNIHDKPINYHAAFFFDLNIHNESFISLNVSNLPL
jgi:hypothetical protein